MTMLQNILLGLIIFLMFALDVSVYILYRNEKVYEYKIMLLHKISVKSQEDITNGKDWEWRYNMFEQVSYNTMLYKFWKPLDTFFKDKSFIE